MVKADARSIGTTSAVLFSMMRRLALIKQRTKMRRA
jgi:hypothetical protein